MIASLQTITRICGYFIIIKMMCSLSSNQHKVMIIKVGHQRCSFFHWMDIRGSFSGHRKWPDKMDRGIRPWVSTSVYIWHLFAPRSTVFIRSVCNVVGWYSQWVRTIVSSRIFRFPLRGAVGARLQIWKSISSICICLIDLKVGRMILHVSPRNRSELVFSMSPHKAL